MTRIDDTIRVAGAREHNLRGVSLDLPKNRLICFTGVSGSGKSSLAFDTLYAEGQRRYIESLSSYARQYIGQLPKPDCDHIDGLSPSISIQQKTSSWNPRSTVGTITQIHDYLRVLFARAGVQHCPRCDRPISAQTREQMVARVLALPEGTPLMLLAPRARAQKGEHRDLFAELIAQGFARARVDGRIIDLSKPPPLDRYRRHDVDVVVDRLVVRASARSRIAEALETALTAGGGTAILAPADAAGAPRATTASQAAQRGASPDADGAPLDGDILLSSAHACTACGVSFEPPDPQLFSFNSPQGMCTRCDGLGESMDFDPELLVPDPTLNFLAPCVVPLRTKPGRWRRHFYEGVARHLGFDLKTPWNKLPKGARDALLFGTGDEHITFEWRGRGSSWKHGGVFEGVIAELQSNYRNSNSTIVRNYYEQFMRRAVCPVCRGARLNPQALAVRLGGDEPGGPAPRNIHGVCEMSIRDAMQFFESLSLRGARGLIAVEPLKEIRARLRFLVDVGLDYLSLDRAAPTLSGGESQRIRLASQIGCGLVGVLYVLDEPSIGLHPRDNQRLLQSLCKLRDMGNTVIVVEHDRDTMLAADHVVDFGPGPGVKGGEVVASGTVAEICAVERSLTGAYLSGRAAIETPATRRAVGPPPSDAAPATRSVRSTARVRRTIPAPAPHPEQPPDAPSKPGRSRGR